MGGAHPRIRLAGSLADQVFSELEKAILEGRLKPGQRLIEAELAAAFGTSRSPIREVIQRLQQAGLVVVNPRRGACVVRLTRSEIEDFMDVREVLEGLAARSAARRATPQDLEQMAAYLERRRVEVTDERTAARIEVGSLDFHDLVIQASHNEPLIQSARASVNSLRLLKHRSATLPGRPLQAWDEHAAIYEAIKAGDAERAEGLTRKHIRGVKEIIMQAWEDEPPDAPDGQEPAPVDGWGERGYEHERSGVHR